MKYNQAIQQAIFDEMKEDQKVVMFGEDIQKNLYGYTNDLLDVYGKQRVINIPLSEAGIVGLACGSAMCGVRPIVDLTTSSFIYVAMDQIVSMISKMQYMYNGSFDVPVTLFCSNMYIGGNAAQHSDRIHSLFLNIPGIKVIAPTSPRTMYFSLRNAIRDNNPVLCVADRSCFWMEEEFDVNEICFSETEIINQGNDITVVSISGTYKLLTELEKEIRNHGISMELIAINSICPLYIDPIIQSIKKTGTLIICDTSCRTGSVASEIASRISQEAFGYLKKPIRIIAAEDAPVPFAKVLEEQIIVTKDKLLNGIIEVYNKF